MAPDPRRIRAAPNERAIDMTLPDRTDVPDDTDWHLQHYADVGAEYGRKHFTRSDSAFSSWILDEIAAVQPNAETVAEVGAGTCVFASLLGERLQAEEPVVGYEPVKELLEGSLEFDNVDAVCGDALVFAREAHDQRFDLVYTKDTAHHFPADDLDQIHEGFCRTLAPGGRYLMVVRTPPNEQVPVGRIARSRWRSVYTGMPDLLRSMRAIDDWDEIEVTRWERLVDTDVDEWIAGIEDRDAWSIFSTLNADEIERTVDELRDDLGTGDRFDFLHAYDVAVFEKHAA